jgi:anti-sigma regulatory factor (Ser/Thr protein kinase)
MEPMFEATMPGTPFGVRMARQELSAVAADCGMDAEGVADVRLAVTEAATNAVMHGYAQGEGELTVTALVQKGELEIVIADAGTGFHDRPDSPGLGVGLSIIATVAERMNIVSSPAGTQIRMAFPCPNGG